LAARKRPGGAKGLKVKTASLRQAVLAAFATSLVFWLLFQLSKLPAIQSASPFAKDPFDAVASFAFQIAVAISLLSLARLVSIHDEDGLRHRAPFILHGILLVGFCVLGALVADAIAVARAWPLPASPPVMLQFLGLGILVLLLLTTSFFLAQAWRDGGEIPAQSGRDALGETIRDCWTLVSVMAAWFIRWLPVLKPVWAWTDTRAYNLARGWNRRLPLANPDLHPWGFAAAFTLLGGALLTAGILISEAIAEGGPASPLIAVLLGLIFFTGEAVAIFLSFLLFGGYLGLRPKINIDRWGTIPRPPK